MKVKHRNTENQSIVSIKFLCFNSLFTVIVLQKTVSVKHRNTETQWKHCWNTVFCKKITVNNE